MRGGGHFRALTPISHRESRSRRPLPQPEGVVPPTLPRVCLSHTSARPSCQSAGPYASGDSYFGYQQPSRQRDLSGDGQVDVVGGAFYDDSTAYDAGGVYIFGGLL